MLLSKLYNLGRLRFYTNISHDRLNNSIIRLITIQRKLHAVVSTKYSFGCLKTIIYFSLCNRFGEFTIAIFCDYIHDKVHVMCATQTLTKITFAPNQMSQKLNGVESLGQLSFHILQPNIISTDGKNGCVQQHDFHSAIIHSWGRVIKTPRS